MLYTRDIAEQVAVLYWPQVIPYLVPGVPARRWTAADHHAPGGHRRGGQHSSAARQRRRDHLVAPGSVTAARAYQAMLDQVEVTVAEQPLPRLQAVGLRNTVFPFLYRLSWGPRESFSPARLRRHGPAAPRSAAARRRR